MTPLVSIIVPSYNYGHFLPETLNSVKNQSLSNWECLIIDDGSTDNTADVVNLYNKHDSRFIYIYQNNLGLSAARNAGIRNAKGSYLQFLDADDLIEPRKLERQVLHFEENPEADIVYSEARFFASENPDERLYSMWGDNSPWMTKASGSGNDILRAFIKGNIMVVSSPLVKKGVFDNGGLFDENLKNHEDWDLWLRCASGGKTFLFLDATETHTLVRYHSSSMSQSRVKMFETNLSIRKKLMYSLQEPELIRLNLDRCRDIGSELAIENIAIKNKIIGFAQLIKYSLNIAHMKTFVCGMKLLFYGK